MSLYAHLWDASQQMTEGIVTEQTHGEKGDHPSQA
jgi:hypothetical protein